MNHPYTFTKPRPRSRALFAEAWECLKEALLLYFTLELPAYWSKRWQGLRNAVVMDYDETKRTYHPSSGRLADWLAVLALLGLFLLFWMAAWGLWIIEKWTP